MRKILFLILVLTALLVSACEVKHTEQIKASPAPFKTSEIKNSPETTSDEFSKNY